LTIMWLLSSLSMSTQIGLTCGDPSFTRMARYAKFLSLKSLATCSDCIELLLI
jgi:hypothetical protein